MTAPGIILVHADEYAGWVFDSGHPTQGRRCTLAREMLLAAAHTAQVKVKEKQADFLPTREQLALVHTSDHIERVLDQGISNEWSGSRLDLGALAHRMAGGTFIAAEALTAGQALTAVNFAGAKHHAMADHSSGFCVFNDFAMVAKHLLATSDTIQRIAIMDIDAHHGDGTEALLRAESSVLTFSVHDSTAFPWTGHDDDPETATYNRALDGGSGDAELLQAVQDFIAVARAFEPDMVFIAIGADGHATDPLASLAYTVDGMRAATTNIRAAFPNTPLLLGGAGGYQPDTITPQAWSQMALGAALIPKGGLHGRARAN